ncbi:MAG: SAM-dependent methyltransferase [Syntrophomonadaceae bacterium]|nr:SAM-dependent methyltransferase [Syntrophomonadaceae bacterium]
MTTLSKRLTLVAEMIRPGRTVADIGGDHARLALFLVEQGVASRVIISELGDGPFTRAGRSLQENSCRGKIELRRGNGLQVLLPGEVDEVVVAGMGGDTIVDILSYDWDKAASFQHFLFQPMTKAKTVRANLAEQGWPIEDERLVREKNRIYIMIAARPGHSPYSLSTLELEVGPLILRAENELQREYIRGILHKLRTAHRQMIHSSRADITRAAAVDLENIGRLEEILNASHSEGHS